MIENDVITKKTTLKEAEKILRFHGVNLSFGWEIALSMLINLHEEIVVDGFGSKSTLSWND